MQAVILCGGQGTRLRELTAEIPKALVEIGDRPIIWHIMQMYLRHGPTEFVLALGHLGDRVREYFDEKSAEFVSELNRNGSSVRFVDTGADTNTGGRMKRLAPYLDEVFFATYGDGLSDLPLDRLLRFHLGHGRLATLTSIRPRLNLGLLQLDDRGAVTQFDEKPYLEAWVNGGFFVFHRAVLEYLGSDSVLERDPMERLAADGQLMAYRHDGFWACMDTYKDNLELNALWESGHRPWCK